MMNRETYSYILACVAWEFESGFEDSEYMNILTALLPTLWGHRPQAFNCRKRYLYGRYESNLSHARPVRHSENNWSWSTFSKGRVRESELGQWMMMKFRWFHKKAPSRHFYSLSLSLFPQRYPPLSHWAGTLLTACRAKCPFVYLGEWFSSLPICSTNPQSIVLILCRTSITNAHPHAVGQKRLTTGNNDAKRNPRHIGERIMDCLPLSMSRELSATHQLQHQISSAQSWKDCVAIAGECVQQSAVS